MPLRVLAGTLLFLVGCAGITPIGELLDNPARYDGKTVRVEGEVKEFDQSERAGYERVDVR
jgi:hypothetical protein